MPWQTWYQLYSLNVCKWKKNIAWAIAFHDCCIFVTLRMICYIENDLSSKEYSWIFLSHIKKIFGDIFVTYQKNIRGYPPPCNGHTSSSFRRAIYTSPEGPVVNFVRFWNSTNLSFILIIGCLIVHSPGGLVWNQEICQSFSWK